MDHSLPDDVETRSRCLISDAYELSIRIRKHGMNERSSIALCCAIFALMNAMLTGDRHDS